MTHPLYPYLSQWCHDNGWTDLFVERYQFWAFPPGSVLPLPLPSDVLEDIHAQHYRSWKYSLTYGFVLVGTMMASILMVLSHSPMPLVAAFACGAVAVGVLEEYESENL